MTLIGTCEGRRIEVLAARGGVVLRSAGDVYRVSGTAALHDALLAAADLEHDGHGGVPLGEIDGVQVIRWPFHTVVAGLTMQIDQVRELAEAVRPAQPSDNEVVDAVTRATEAGDGGDGR
jgi:hypothetical protein